MIPWQMAGRNTVESRQQPFGLYVNLDYEGGATGTLYWDDGESLNPGDQYALIRFEHRSINTSTSQLSITCLHSGFFNQNRFLTIDSITILGAKPVHSIQANNELVNPMLHTFRSGVLELGNLNLRFLCQKMEFQFMFL